MHSAAIAGDVDILVTDDLDFLDLDVSISDGLPYDILSADDSMDLADGSGPAGAGRMVLRQWGYWRSESPCLPSVPGLTPGRAGGGTGAP